MPVKDCALDLEQIKCSSNLFHLQKIIDKINNMQKMELCILECCDQINDGEVIRSLLVGDRLYLTNDGSNPIEVPLNGMEPYETYMNGVEMKQIFWMGTNLREIYMNTVLVFRGVLEIELPQYTSNIDLMKLINEKNVDNFILVRVVNNLIQPSITTGNTTGLEVELVNNGEFQGFSSGGDAMHISHPIKLNNNGWIRGAGGNGGNGGGTDLGGIPSTVGVWTGKAGHDDGSRTPGKKGHPCTGPSGAHYNRFWYPGGTGAWIDSRCNDSLQEYWNTNSSPVWGDQGRCHTVKHGFRVRHGGGINLQVIGSATTSVSGGRLGRGGAGIGFRRALNAGRTTGRPGSYSGPSNGFNPSNGKNYNLPSGSGTFVNGDGGYGGNWGSAGTAGTIGGSAGHQPGRAIVGIVNLFDSYIGNVNGALV